MNAKSQFLDNYVIFHVSSISLIASLRLSTQESFLTIGLWGLVGLASCLIPNDAIMTLLLSCNPRAIPVT